MYKGGTLENFAGSMAESIEKEIEKIWTARYKNPLPEGTRADRRLLFIAIAHGIIKHLREKAEEAIDVKVNVDQIPLGNLVISGGKSGKHEYYQNSHRHKVTVIQKEQSDNLSYNKVKSKGEGIVKILMEELDL